MNRAEPLSTPMPAVAFVRRRRIPPHLLWLAGVVVLVLLLLWIRRPQGIEADLANLKSHLEPLQEKSSASPFQFETRLGPVEIQPRASYDISAVIAATERYVFDRTAFLSPLDAVLLWGEMDREPYDGAISYAQMGRFYFWRTKSRGISTSYISRHSANVHLVPSTPNLRKAVLSLGKGDRIRARGYLVDVRGPKGLRWGTSLVRTDTGNGACEILWIEELQVGRRVYR